MSALSSNSFVNNNQTSINTTSLQMATWANGGEISSIKKLFKENKQEAQKICNAYFSIAQKQFTPFHYAVKSAQWKVCALFINYGVGFERPSLGTLSPQTALEGIDKKEGALKKIVQELVSSKEEINFNSLLKLFTSKNLSVGQRELVYQDRQLCQNLCAKLPRRENQLLLMAALLIGSFCWEAMAGGELMNFIDPEKEHEGFLKSTQPASCWHLFIYASWLTGISHQTLQNFIFPPLQEIQSKMKNGNPSTVFALKEAVIRLMGCQTHISELEKIKAGDTPKIICFCQVDNDVASSFHFVLLFKNEDSSYVIHIEERTKNVVCQQLLEFWLNFPQLFKLKKDSKIEAFEGMISWHKSLSEEDQKSN